MPASLRSIVALGVIALAFASSACSAPPGDRSDSASGASDAIADRASLAESQRAAPSAVLPQRDCGAGPYVELGSWLLELGPYGQTPLEGATLSFDVCPGYAVRTDEFGIAKARVPRGVPVVARFSAPGHVTALVSQSVLDADSIVTDLLPTLSNADVLPEYAPDRPSFAIFVAPIGSGPCAFEDGVTLAIDGRPDARALYMPPSWPATTQPSTSSATERGGVVFFAGLSAGDRVHVVASKPGCAVRTKEGQQTGEFALENGAWTVGNVYVDDP